MKATKYKVGEYLMYMFPKYYKGGSKVTAMVRVMDSTITFSGAKKRVPVQWLNGGATGAWYLCPENLLRRPTKKEMTAWQIDQL